MSRSRLPFLSTSWSVIVSVGVLALLAYVPAMTAAPGRMPADSKLYLYLDPGRFLVDAASSFDPRQFAGWVPHQHIAYLWPSGPWFWLFDAIGVPDWIAHRWWIGTLMLAAGLGVRWCTRLLGLGQTAALVAALVYQLSPYILPYVSRTSVLLLPWAGLGWIVGLTIRATRRRSWVDPALIALVVLTVGAVNATALAMIIPAPTLWLVHAVWQRLIGWRAAVAVAARVAVLSIGVSLWWIAMLVIQGRQGVDVLPYSESLGDVSLTATSTEVWRSLGYWLFYVRDPYAATTTESLRYLVSSPAILVSFALPLLCVAGSVVVRWAHRRFAMLLVVAGAVLAVGVHPIDDRSPLMRLLAGDDESGLALALRSSTRALPVMNLGLALAAGSLVAATSGLRLTRKRVALRPLVAGSIAALAIVNLPAVWNGAFVDPALERDQDPPAAWLEAAEALDEGDPDARVLQIPGAEFGAFRWGYTVDQPLPGLTEKPLVTRDLLPLGSASAMDLLFAFDDRIQSGVLEPTAVAPVSRLLGVDTIWLTDDLAFDRFRTARPEVVASEIEVAPGVGTPVEFGPPAPNVPDVAMVDERALGDPRVGEPLPTVALFPLERPGAIVRAGSDVVVVSGSGDGLVDLAAARLIDGSEVVRYSASLEGEALIDALGDANALLVTDSNRDRARHWRGSQDTAGYTEPGGGDQDVLRPVASDQRLPLFDTDEVVTQTTAVQRGPITATATAYGEPFAYLPEHRPYMAVDGDPSTAWIVGDHGDPLGERLHLDVGETVTELVVRQPAGSGEGRWISGVTVAVTDATGRATGAPMRVVLDERSLSGGGQVIALPAPAAPGAGIDITLAELQTPVPAVAGAAAGVGFADVVAVGDGPLGPTVEVVRPPSDALAMIDEDLPLGVALSRVRSDPMDRWRSDPETRLIREFELGASRSVSTVATVRIDPRATDTALAALFEWPAVASTRLTGSLRNAGVSALDDDPSTSWITAFGDAVGARLRVGGVAEQIAELTISQPTGDFSPITALTVRSGGLEQTTQLDRDPNGVSTIRLDPPLPAGDVEIEIADVESMTTIDRRFADLVELPAAVSEIEFVGRPTAVPVGDSRATVDCAPLLEVDGAPMGVSVTIADDGWLDGDALASDVCDPDLDLGQGPHLVAGLATDLPFTVDRLLFTDGVSPVAGAPQEGPTAVIAASGRFDRSIEVGNCPDGCWLVFGEGYNTAWRASGPEGDLGSPRLVDGGFNGWWIAGRPAPVTIHVRWTAQRPLTVSIVLSALAALCCVVLLLAGRRRQPTIAPASARAPRFVTRLTPISTRRSVIAGAIWILAAVLLIDPSWALWGVVGAAMMVVLRRTRLAELTAIACLIVVVVGVVWIERRDAPFPNGAWPTEFESLHGLGMFAVVSLLVGAVVGARPPAIVADAGPKIYDPEMTADDSMPHPAPAFVASYQDRGEAEVSVAHLRSFDIEAFIIDDIEGGALPVDAEFAVGVFVHAADADRAREVLADAPPS